MPDAADFNLNLLKTFLSLYRERNMTRAARELGLAVSTVSEHLKLLREAYGDPLFLPSDKGLAPSAGASRRNATGERGRDLHVGRLRDRAWP